MSGLLQPGPLQTVALGTAILAALAGVLGCFAVLRRQSLMGDVLAHAALPGICVGFLLAGERSLPALLAGALVAGALATALTEAILRLTRIKPDAAMGIVLSGFFALGVVLLSWLQGRGGAGQAGLNTFLFGQAAAMLRQDVILMAGVAVLVLGIVAALWRDLKLLTFDPDFARASGRPVGLLRAVLSGLTAVAIVLGLQVVGVVLMVALLIAPAVAARQWVSGLLPMVLLAGALGALAGVAGALISAGARGLATGPVIVLVAAGMTLLSLLIAPRRGLLWRGRG